ncbi:MAG: hypothetical protein ACP5RI_02895 [Candidatus Micrarchaeia archaeon]|uniref:hypothetical protein n=1 Tax=Caldisericum sp. TaxID=2499687 RepID=UPI003D0BB868
MEGKNDTGSFYPVWNADVDEEKSVELSLLETAKFLYLPDDLNENIYVEKKNKCIDSLEHARAFFAKYYPPEHPFLKEMDDIIQEIVDYDVDSLTMRSIFVDLETKILWRLGKGDLNFIRPQNPVAKWYEKLAAQNQIPYTKEVDDIFTDSKKKRSKK